MRRVFKHLPKTLVGNPEAVHEMRVASRRLRVTLPILARGPEGRRVKRALAVLRELTRAAGSGRGLEVSADLLDARLRSLGTPSAGQTLVRQRLQKALRRSRRRMAEALLDVDIARLRRDLRSIVESGPADEHTVLGRLRETRDAGGEAVRQGLKALGERFDPEALHRLRRQARRLGYLAEVNDALHGEDSGAPAAFKALQERFGVIHDSHVLGDWLSELAARADTRGDAALVAEASSLARWFDELSRRHHRSLLEGHPVQVVSKALEAMGRARTAGLMRRARRLASASEGPAILA